MKRWNSHARHAIWASLLSFCTSLLSVSLAMGANRWEASFGGAFKSIVGREAIRQKGLSLGNDRPFAEQRMRLEGELSRPNLRLDVASEWSILAESQDSTSSVDLTQRLDRASIQVNQDRWEGIVGRQALSTGVGRLFQAIDQNPRPPLVFVDPEYPQGRDAVTVRYTDRLTLEASVLPPEEEEIDPSFFVRAKGTFLGEHDLAFVLGQSHDKVYGGFESVVNLNESLLRGEAVAYAHAFRPVFQGILGIDHVFSEQWSGTLELFYNGFGAGHFQHYQAIPEHRSAKLLGQFYIGTSAEWELSPIFQIRMGSLTNLIDRSSLIQLQLNYAITQQLDLLVGQTTSLASHSRSEFGGTLPLGFGTEAGLSDLTYVVLRLYF